MTSGCASCSTIASNLPKDLLVSDFWFHDGNIIIKAGNAMFKVHRGQLERHSEVFNGLFTLPQPQEQPMIDGCVCVELYDAPSDVFHFLKALYDGLYFETPRANDFSAISGVLRLSTKYFVEHLRERCLRRLYLDWPCTLAGWDLREQSATDSFGRYLPRETCPHPILIIQLGLELGIHSILPAAFYDLARYGPSKIMCGTYHPPRVIDSYLPPQLEENRAFAGLTDDQLVQTLRGREKVQTYLADFIVQSLQSRAPSENCVYRFDVDASRPCHESFYFIMLNLLRSIGGIACGRDADTLYTLTQAMDMLTRTDFSDGQKQCGLNMCYACKVEFAACAVKAREEVWSSLPSWFGLSDSEMVL